MITLARILVVVVTATVPAVAHADTVYFKNGKSLEADVLEVTDDSVTVRTKNGQRLSYARQAVERITKYESPVQQSVASVGTPTAPERLPAEIFDQVAPAVVVIRTDSGGGSGFIVDHRGLIVTALHVVVLTDNAEVRLKDGRAFPVTTVAGLDAWNDVCIVKIDAEGLPTVPLGDSDALRVGQRLMVIGAPLGYEYSVSDGLFSGRRLWNGRSVLQVTVPSSPGNSGGPLLDMSGSVAGVMGWSEPGGQNLNFAWPISAVKPLMSGTTSMPFSEFSEKVGQAFGLLYQAVQLTDNGTIEAAVPLLERAIQGVPAIAVPAHILLGEVYAQLGRWQEAVKLFATAVALDPTHPGLFLAYSDLCAAYGKLGQLDEALEACEQAVALNPTFPDALRYQLAVYTKMEKFDKAEAVARKALQLDPSNAEVHANLGYVYFSQGMLDEAITELQRAVKIDPSDSIAHFNLGTAYRFKGLQQEAASSYQAALAINPNDINANLDLAVIYYYADSSHHEAAVPLFEKILELTKDSRSEEVQEHIAQSYFFLGAIAARKGELEESRAHWSKLQALHGPIAEKWQAELQRQFGHLL